MNHEAAITTPEALVTRIEAEMLPPAPFVLAQHDEPAESHDASAADTHAAEAASADAHAAESHEGDASAADAHAAAGDHTAEGGHGHDAPAAYQLPSDFPNIYSLTTKLVTQGHAEHHGAHESVLKGPFEVHPPFFTNPAFAFVYVAVFIMIIRRILRRASIERPGRAQIALESVFQGLMNTFGEVLGSEANARKYVPYVGSLWLFIWINIIMGIVPGFKATVAHFWTAAALGLCTFFYVNYHGIKAGGLWHYFWHLCGSPTSGLTWVFAPLIFVLELVGTFVKPVSLTLRLSGNIFGEDKLLAAFMGLGMMITAAVFGTPTPPFGLPLHFPFLFLSVLTSLIQATVFSLLATVYIAMLLPHDDHGHGEEHGHAAAHGDPKLAH